MRTILNKIADALLGKSFDLAVTPNTFIIWEPCTHSHAEVVPGYAKYLLDLGLDVAVLMTPERYDEGLFSRFRHERLTLHRHSQRSIRKHFRAHGLGRAKGVLITTARKISGAPSYDAEEHLFARRHADQKLLLVEHDVQAPADVGALHAGIITLREPHYRDARTTAINPHYFGEVRVTPKSTDVTRFITIGALRGKRRNTSMLMQAVQYLHEAGVTDFKIAVIGRGSISGIPLHLRCYVDLLGEVSFSRLYDEMEAADFFLPLLDPDNPRHDRYITTGTSGSFQLIFGFRKPCLLAAKFAEVNSLDNHNGIVHESGHDLANAMMQAIRLSTDAYTTKQLALAMKADIISAESLERLRQLILARE